MKSFEQEISGSLSASEVSAEGSFTAKLSSAADKNKVSVEVQYNVVGNAGNTQYDKGDIVKTFNSFREAAKPVPYQAFLRHYSAINSDVSRTIDMDPDVYGRVCEVFMLARLVFFLIGVAPGSRTVRMERRDKISKIFSEIYAKRLAYEANPDALKPSLEKLTALHEVLRLRLQRQDLIMEMHSITYEDMKKKFTVNHENSLGAWVSSYKGSQYFVLGRTGFSNEEMTKYAVVEKRDVAEVDVSGSLFHQQVGSIEFPGTTGIDGYVVGLTIESVWKDGTDGLWCIDTGLSLGTKQAKVEVKSESSRGMNWKLHVHYIPASEYDE
ncbi:hypothetical protein C8R44DRAFT_783779 [Mycena epipterygia]|nr:hypothetical protein C8R44DRAFT_783779 [Mycena epipterygia]